MKRTPLYLALAGLAVSGASTLTYAQDTGQVIEEVIVTGSYIPGSPEDAAVPIDVVTSEEMSKIGSPDMLEFIKNTPVSAGVLGESNQFDARAQGADGAGTVNLRGLGPTRTLVLINGRRVAVNPYTGAVDTNLLPLAAMGRVEMLKDGAAVLYGSDAVAGVVNFITKKDLDGFDIGFDHKFIEGSNGDSTLKVNWGWVGDNSNLLLSAGYQRRTELDTLERDWLDKTFLENPNGGWTGGGSPTGFISTAVAGLGQLFQDPGCQTLGGVNYLMPDLAGLTVPRCRFNYTDFDNLIDPLERYQVHGEYNLTFGPDIELRTELTYSKTETEYNTSPSYLATQAPTVNIAGRYFVSAAHPAIANFAAAYNDAYTGDPSNWAPDTVNPSAPPAGDLATLTSATLLMAPLTFRPFGIGGNPLYGGEGVVDDRSAEQIRLSTGLSGMLTDTIGWDVNLAYSEVEGFREGHDTRVNRFNAALNGLGGPDCSAGSLPGSSGCYWFNPFSTAIQRNYRTGVVNPYYDEDNANDNATLNNWFFERRWDETTTSNLTFDAVFNGDLPLELSGGIVQWAAGVQYRKNEFERDLSANQDLAINPCPAADTTALNPTFTSCEDAGELDGTGIFMFLGGSNEISLDQDVSAAFAEFKLPVLDTLEVTVAARYEDYGGETGDTFDPKLAARWQATDWLAVRGSYSSTFRAPTPTQLDTGSVTSLQNINNSFRAVDVFGDAGLQPEKADTFNLGVIFDTGSLYASLDWWQFDLTETLAVDPLGGMVATLFGDPDEAADDRCGEAAVAGLEDRFTFAGGCAIDNIARVETFVVNGSDRTTDGIDWNVNYAWDLDNGDVVTVGTAGSYIMSFDLEDVYVEGVIVEESRDAVGFLNAQTSAFPLPELKGNIYGEYTKGSANYRLTMRGVSDYTDQRVEQIAGQGEQKVDSMITYDFNYRYIWSTDFAETLVNVSIENLTDEDPPFVALELDYDPFTHSPLGRTFKVGVSTTF